MSKDEGRSTVLKCRENINSFNSTLSSLLNLVNQRNSSASALQAKVAQLKTSLDQLRTSVDGLPDIQRDFESQLLAIAGLQRQLQIKNDFIVNFRDRDFDIMSSGDVPAESSNAPAASTGPTNPTKLYCTRCESVVLGENLAEVITDFPMELPPVTVNKNALDTENPPDVFTDWLLVNDLLSFENVGVTRVSQGKKYLCCADCEVGPIGIIIEPKKYYVAAARVRTKL